MILIAFFCRIKYLFSAFNLSLRSSGQPQHSARGRTPESKPVLTGDRPNVHVLTVGETGAPGENPHRHGENMQTPHREALPQPGIEPRTLLLLGYSASHYATMPPNMTGSSVASLHGQKPEFHRQNKTKKSSPWE